MTAKIFQLIIDDQEDQALALLNSESDLYKNATNESGESLLYFAFKHGRYKLVVDLIRMNAKIPSSRQNEAELQEYITSKLYADDNDQNFHDLIIESANNIIETRSLKKQRSLFLLQANMLLCCKHDDEISFIYILKIIAAQNDPKTFILPIDFFSINEKKDIEGKILRKAIEYLSLIDTKNSKTEVINFEKLIIANLILQRLDSPLLDMQERELIENAMHFFRDMHFHSELKCAVILREPNEERQQDLLDELIKSYPKFKDYCIVERCNYWRAIEEMESQPIINQTQKKSNPQENWNKLRHVYFDYNQKGKLATAKPMGIKYQHEIFSKHQQIDRYRRSATWYYINIWKQTKHNISLAEWWSRIDELDTNFYTEYLSTERLNANHKLNICNGEFLDSQGEKLHCEDSPASRIDFVWRVDNSIYYYLPKDIPQDVDWHHSSLSQGRPTKFAGEMAINNGSLVSVTPYSGHYRHTEEYTVNFLTYLLSLNVNIDKLKVLDTEGNTYFAINFMNKFQNLNCKILKRRHSEI